MNTLTFTTFRFASALLLGGTLLTCVPASAGDVHTVLGAGVGAMTGAAIGQSVGGYDGAVVGAVAGSVIGAGLSHNAQVERSYYPQPHAYSPPPPPPRYYQPYPSVRVEPPPVYSNHYYWRAEPYYPRHHRHHRGYGPRDYSPGYYGGHGGGRGHRW
ncbi:MAG: hypothetical protein IPH35_13160 [Rhodoferax sp.]|nr:hypothetical protein [Rhodoferax sp.]